MKPRNISDVEVNFNFNFHISKFNVQSRTAISAIKTIEKYREPTPTIAEDSDAIFEKSMLIFKGDSDEILSEKEIRIVALVVLNKSDDRKFYGKLFKKINEIGTRRLYSALLSSYVMYFDGTRGRFKLVAEMLQKNTDKLSRAWRRRINVIDVLDFNSIEENFARKILEHGGENKFLDQIGLGSYRSSKLVTAAIMALAKLISDQVKQGDFDNIETFIEIICDNKSIKGNAGVAAMIGLLQPFVDKQTPPDWIKNIIKDVFIKSFSDPRVSRHRWPEIDEKFGGQKLREDCMAIFTKWIINDTIDLFFKIIAEHAPDNQFAPRRDLWKTYFAQNYVSNAWVILGADAVRTAWNLRQTGGVASGLDWGKLEGAGTNQSVLLMKIKDLVVAEWSHNGKFRAWSANKPRFNQSKYHADQLRKNSNRIMTKSGNYSDGIVHLGDWVSRAQSYIEEQTGIRLSRKIR